MIEIQVPCCNAPVVIEPEAEEVRCEACAIVHELAADARLAAVAIGQTALLAA